MQHKALSPHRLLNDQIREQMCSVLEIWKPFDDDSGTKAAILARGKEEMQNCTDSTGWRWDVPIVFTWSRKL
jgi:hypothetical protein